MQNKNALNENNACALNYTQLSKATHAGTAISKRRVVVAIAAMIKLKNHHSVRALRSFLQQDTNLSDDIRQCPAVEFCMRESNLQ